MAAPIAIGTYETLGLSGREEANAELLASSRVAETQTPILVFFPETDILFVPITPQRLCCRAALIPVRLALNVQTPPTETVRAIKVPDSLKKEVAMERREFLKAATVSGLASPILMDAQTEFPKRQYRDDVKLSIIGFGGIIMLGLDQDHANRVVAEAIGRGVNYFDVAPSYGNGEAEQKLGVALEPHRKNVFLACKAEKRDAQGAREQLETSLKRLKTDHFDLYQFHAVGTVADAKKILGPGGAAEAFVKAKRDGLARYIGFSAHGVDAAQLLMESMPLDSVLFPVNYVNYAEGDFGPQILAEAKKRGLARMALKALAQTTWKPGEEKTYKNCWYRPIEDPALAEKALRFTLSEDVTAAIPPGYEKFLKTAMQIASRFTPLTQTERQHLLASARGITPIFTEAKGAAA